jgi:hypothetical protein
MLFRVGINQFLVGIGSSPVVVLIRFRGRWLISVVGSKIQKKFLIVFSLYIYIYIYIYDNERKL